MSKILFNGKVYLDRGEFREALLIEGDRIQAVGSNEEIRALASSDTEFIDCEGRTVIPGLNDSHMHFMQFGETRNQAMIEDVTSIDEMIEVCKRFANEHPQSVKDGIHAIGWNQDNFRDSDRLPDRHDLDKISTDIPIVLERVCGHIVSTNSKLISMLDMSVFKEEDYMVGEDGEPNGIFKGNGTNLAKKIVPDFSMEERYRIMLEAMDYAAAHGLTSVQSNDIGTTFMDGPAAFDLLHRIYDSGKAKVRYRHQVCFNDFEAFQDYIENGEFAHKEELYPEGSWLTLGPLKLFKDGSLGARTALVSGGYVDDRDNHGLEWMSNEDMDRYCALAAKHGLQVVTHAIGDEALSRTIDSYEKAFVDGKNKLRHVLNHVQITDPALIKRIADLDILTSVQPIFLDYDMRILNDLLGEELGATSYAWKSLSEAGVHVSYGTDCPVEDCNPFPNIYCAVTRKNKAGSPEGGFNPQECVDVETAIDAYTTGSAYNEFMEEEKGRLRAGFYADLVVLDKDIFTVDPEEISSILPVLTMVGGRIVYRRA
ncbi:amidohydrolase [Eubacterium sp. AB3007]|uniref:amidohydrolase n=1 Tax=Eubacterium sp. AB3007 TaxID=1392487 RepID=UPI00047F85E5|nr:amidohydrolase [Eubacterium sp. AB3007]